MTRAVLILAALLASTGAHACTVWRTPSRYYSDCGGRIVERGPGWSRTEYVAQYVPTRSCATERALTGGDARCPWMDRHPTKRAKRGW